MVELNHRFETGKGTAHNWDAVLDLDRLIPCVEGGKVLERQSDEKAKAEIKVKMGAMSMTFREGHWWVGLCERGRDVRHRRRRWRDQHQGDDQRQGRVDGRGRGADRARRDDQGLHDQAGQHLGSPLKHSDTPAAAHPPHLAPPATLTCQRHATLVAGGPRHWRLHHISRIAHASTDS